MLSLQKTGVRWNSAPWKQGVSDPLQTRPLPRGNVSMPNLIAVGQTVQAYV